MAANALRGEVAIRLGGRERVLRPSFSALLAIEDSLRPILALAQEAAEGRVALGDLAIVIHHCLLIEPGETRPSVADIGDLLLADGMLGGLAAWRSLLERTLGGIGDAA